jgi:hypothetical protein
VLEEVQEMPRLYTGVDAGSASAGAGAGHTSC